MERRNAENEISDESIFDLFRNRTDAEPRRWRSTATSGRRRSTPCRSCRSRAPTPSPASSTPAGAASAAAAYRVTVYISDPALDARSLKVAAFRQSGGRAVPVGDAENRALEDAILTRARQLRIAAAGS